MRASMLMLGLGGKFTELALSGENESGPVGGIAVFSRLVCVYRTVTIPAK
jgi:hypothetical protein